MTEIADSDLTVSEECALEMRPLSYFANMGEHFKVADYWRLTGRGGHFSVSARRMDGPVPGPTRP